MFLLVIIYPNILPTKIRRVFTFYQRCDGGELTGNECGEREEKDKGDGKVNTFY